MDFFWSFVKLQTAFPPLSVEALCGPFDEAHGLGDAGVCSGDSVSAAVDAPGGDAGLDEDGGVAGAGAHQRAAAVALASVLATLGEFTVGFPHSIPKGN